MLNTILQLGKKVIVTVMLALLVLSFAIWGVGDMFRGRASDAVATVGDETINAGELRKVAQAEIEKIKHYFGDALPADAMQAFQVERRALEQMINEKLLDVAIRDNKILLGDKPALTEIVSVPQFQQGDKTFNKEAFERFLRERGETEAGFIQIMKESIARQMFMNAVAAGFIAPDLMVEEVYKYDGEKRTAKTITIPKDFVISVKEPSETELVEYYESAKHNFATPEYRDISYIVIDKSSIDISSEINDEMIKKSYDERVAEFTKPEVRTLLAMLFDNEAKAKEAYEKLQSGAEFLAVARDFAGQEPEQTKYGKTTKDDFISELADTAFSLSKGAYSQPVQSSLGWHILKIEEIEPAEAKPFESVKDKVKKDLFETKGDELLYSLSNKIEDMLAGGASLEEIASEAGVKIQVIKSVNSEGKSPKGETIQGLPVYDNFLTIAFSTSEGELSEQAHNSDSSAYFVVRIDKTEPERTKALDEVKGSVISSWKEQKKDELTQKIAEFASTKFAVDENLGRDSLSQEILSKEVEEFAKYSGKVSGSVQIAQVGPVRRYPELSQKQTPKQMIDELFGLEIGRVTNPFRLENGSYIVARLAEIIPADMSLSKEGINNTRASIEQEFSDDVWQQYLNYLRLVYPVKIYEEKLSPAEKENL